MRSGEIIIAHYKIMNRLRHCIWCFQSFKEVKEIEGGSECANIVESSRRLKRCEDRGKRKDELRAKTRKREATL